MRCIAPVYSVFGRHPVRELLLESSRWNVPAGDETVSRRGECDPVVRAVFDVARRLGGDWYGRPVPAAIAGRGHLLLSADREALVLVREVDAKDATGKAL